MSRFGGKGILPSHRRRRMWRTNENKLRWYVQTRTVHHNVEEVSLEPCHSKLGEKNIKKDHELKDLSCHRDEGISWETHSCDLYPSVFEDSWLEIPILHDFTIFVATWLFLLWPLRDATSNNPGSSWVTMIHLGLNSLPSFLFLSPKRRSQSNLFWDFNLVVNSLICQNPMIPQEEQAQDL